MAKPRSTSWRIEPHTRAKHAILRRYLGAWFPILGRGFEEVVYLDGFAGPGFYEGGEEGSPVVALRLAQQHAARIRGRLHFRFVEKDPARADALRTAIAALQLPPHFTTEVLSGTELVQILDQVLTTLPRLRAGRPAPLFAFLDPFGWTGIPFRIIAEILRRPNAEVLVNIMYEEINRFLSLPEQERNFDELFGTPVWRQANGLVDPVARRRLLHDLYSRQLREAAGATFVRSFQMRNSKDVTDYFLFFATQNKTGMARMKEAMWKIDPTGEFQFSDANHAGQGLLFGQNPDLTELERLLVARFAGRETTVGEVEEFVLADTPFRETHYKPVLKLLEKTGRVVPIDPPPSRRAGTYADPALRLRFAGST